MRVVVQYFDCIFGSMEVYLRFVKFEGRFAGVICK